MKVLLTGATGFLGAEVLRQLQAAGHAVRVLVRRSSRPERVPGPPTEVAWGDVLAPETVRAAVAGCEAVVHTAAQLSMRLRDQAQLTRTNQDGTRNVLDAALEAHVRRVVLTSSIGTIGVSASPALLDETTPWDLERLGLAYLTSKRRAEEAALARVAQGLPLVVLNPGTLLGPGDVNLTSTRILLEFLNGTARVCMDGGTSFADVRDVAAAHVAALTHGRVGERYIVAGQNFSYQHAYAEAARLSGRPRTLHIPKGLAFAFAAASQGLARLTPHRLEDLNVPFMRLATSYNFMDVRKAQVELGYRVRPFSQTVRDTLRDHLRRGLVRADTLPLRALAADEVRWPVSVQT